MSQQPPTVTCVVLNWNGWRDTIPCIASVLAQDYPHLHLIVVDNASTDGSVAHIRSAHLNVEILPSPANDGFSAGNNQGIRLALERNADFLWLLNNDTIAPPDTLTKLVAAVTNPNVGIVGTVLRYMHEPARIQAWGGGTIYLPLGFSTHYTQPTPLGPDSTITFASVLLSAPMLRSIGLLDPGFFMYYEDVDLCLRARNEGWQLAVAADTAVLHKEGGSAPTRKNPTTDRIVTASGIRFLRRHGRPRTLAPALFVLSRLAKRSLRFDLQGVLAVLAGVRDWWQANPTAFQSTPTSKDSAR